MVILLVRNGQLCNRLFSISAFLANSIEFKYPMVCNSFDDYYEKFEYINKICRPYNVRFLKSNAYFRKLLIKIFFKCTLNFPKVALLFGYLIYNDQSNINNSEYINKATKKKLFVHGWPYWDVKNFIKHSTEIRKIFTPKASYFDSAEIFLKKLDPSYDVLVGVHVRRGDYKYYLKGRFYFSCEIYLQKMDEIYSQLIALNKNPVFIICSNEKFSSDKHINFRYKVSFLNDVSDLILLSKCNYIFGPPSTYSMWASFYGNVPYNNFFSEKEVLKIEDFSPIIAPSTFANGKELVDVYENYNI